MVHQWANSATHTSSQWAVYRVDQESDAYVLANVRSNKLLAVIMNNKQSGVGLHQWSNDQSHPASQWRLVPDTSTPADVNAQNAGQMGLQGSNPDEQCPAD